MSQPDNPLPDVATIATMAGEAGLPGLLRAHRDRVLALLAELDQAGAQWATPASATPTVVLVGETNRGKSSLVNAVLATQGLSPVSAEVATATYLVFGYAERWSARACYPGRAEPVPFPLEQLVNWASSTAELPAGELPPHHVAVDGPVPLLRALSVVDTPGVGGLDEIHGELAIEAAESATALLFVADASAPLTSGELDFLRRAAARVETVLFALTKIDQYRGWRQILTANRALLAQHAPRLAEVQWLPVSATLFEMASRAPNPQAAAMLRERSGVAPLQTALQRVVTGRAELLADANMLRTATTALAELAARFSAQRRALRAGADEAEALRARRDELTAQRRSSARGWPVKLRGEIQRCRVELGHEVARQIRETQTWFRRKIDVAGRDDLRRMPMHVDAALRVMSGQLSDRLAWRLGEVAETALADLFSAEELDLIRADFARGGQPAIVVRPPDARPPTAEDKLLVFLGVSSGLGLGRAVTPLAGLVIGAAATPVLVPVTIAGMVLGLGAGWWMARTRRQTADRQHLKQWLSDAITDSRSTVEQVVSEQLISAEQQLSLAMDDAVARRIAAIEDELRAVDDALRMDAEERSARVSAIDKHLADIADALGKTDRLLARTRSTQRPR